MAAVTICSDFGAQKNKVCHCFPIYLPWSDGTGCHDLTYIYIKHGGLELYRLDLTPSLHFSAVQETWVRYLSQENPLEKKGMATHSNLLAWRIPWTEEPGGLQSMGSQRAGHDWVTNTHFTAAFRPKQSHLAAWITDTAEMYSMCLRAKHHTQGFLRHHPIRSFQILLPLGKHIA